MTPPTKTEDEGLLERTKARCRGTVSTGQQAEDIRLILELADRITSLEGELDTWKRARLESEEVIHAIVVASGARSEKHDIIQHVTALLARAQALEGELEEARKRLARIGPAEEDEWVDEREVVWVRPTAWAYAAACKALHAHKDALSNVKQRASVEEMSKMIARVAGRAVGEKAAKLLHAHLFPSEKNNG